MFEIGISNMNKKRGQITRLKQLKIVKEIVRRLARFKEVKAIYLFGSYARQTPLPISDIDLCVITQESISDERKAGILSHSSERIDVSLFRDLPIAIRYAVLKEGRPLFVRDSEFLITSQIKTLHEYLDFKAVIKRFAEAVGVKYA